VDADIQFVKMRLNIAKHSDCSPLAYLIVNYNGVKYGNIDKAIVEETKRLLINPPAYADGTKICEVLNNGMAR